MALIMIKKSEFSGFLDEFLNDECTIYRHCAAVALVEKKKHSDHNIKLTENISKLEIYKYLFSVHNFKLNFRGFF